jgi:hypothetical protein
VEHPHGDEVELAEKAETLVVFLKLISGSYRPQMSKDSNGNTC